MNMGSWVLCSDSILGSIRKNPDLMLHEGNSRFHHDQSSIHLASLPWCSAVGGGTSQGIYCMQLYQDMMMYDVYHKKK